MPCSNHPRYLILGGGISALSLAWFLQKQAPSAQITLLEKENRLGGWIDTFSHKEFIFEKGPHSIRIPERLSLLFDTLFEDLDLSNHILPITPFYKKRYLAFNDTLHPINLNLKTLIHPKNFKNFHLPLFQGLFKKPLQPSTDLSLATFFESRFGPYLTNHFVDPMVMGIMGGQLDKLSLRACFPNLHAIATKKTPLLMQLFYKLAFQKSKLISFSEGFIQLINAFEKKLRATIELNTPVLKIQYDSSLKVITPRKTYEADHIFSTLPAQSLADLFPHLPARYKHFLQNQKKVSYKIIYLGFDQPLNLPQAFGYIAPSWSQQGVSGVIFDTSIFPNQETSRSNTRLSAMIHQNSPLYFLNSNLLKEKVIEELQKVLKIKIAPKHISCFEAKEAISQYHLGHVENVNALSSELKRICPFFTFLGTSFYGISVPSCIEKAYEISKENIDVWQKILPASK